MLELAQHGSEGLVAVGVCALIRYQGLVEATSAAVWIREPDGSAVHDAPALRAITGQAVEDYRGWGFLDALDPMHRDVGIVTNCTAEFWDICKAGANKAAAQYNVELLFRQPEKAFDASAQMPIVEAWAKQGLNVNVKLTSPSSFGVCGGDVATVLPASVSTNVTGASGDQGRQPRPWLCGRDDGAGRPGGQCR